MGIKISPMTVDKLMLLMYFIVVAAPFLLPIKLPLTVSDTTRGFYDTIIEVPDGGTVLWTTDLAFYHWNEQGSGQVAIYKTLFTMAQENNVKIVVFTFMADGVAVLDRIFDEYLEPAGFLDGLTYGEDYVNLGFMPGWESAMASIANDIHATARTDVHGTPVDQIPMMSEIKTIEDFNLIGWGGTRIDEYARQWTGKGIPLIVNMGSWGIGAAVPWFEEGLIGGYLNGQRGCAEFEKLTGYPGLASQSIDSTSLNHLYAIFLLLGGNIYFLMKGGRMQAWRRGER